MNWKAAAIASLLTALISANTDVNAAQSVRTLALGVLRIGTYFVNPPFEYVSEGKNVGFEVDLMNEIARRLVLTTLLREHAMGADFAADAGWSLRLYCRWDHYHAGAAADVGLVHAYMTTTLSLVVDSKRTPQIKSLADLKEAAVGVQAATTDYGVVVRMQKRGQIKRAQVYPFDVSTTP